MFKNYKKYSDIELVERFVKSRDSRAFQEIYDRNFESVYRYIYSRVGNKAWCEDITSSTFEVLIDVLESYSGKYKLKNFIIGIAVNKIKQFWTIHYKRNETEMLEDYIIETDENEENVKYSAIPLKILQEIMDSLPENYKNVLTERFINSKSVKETASLLQLTEANVRVIQNRAIKKACEIGTKIYEK